MIGSKGTNGEAKAAQWINFFSASKVSPPIESE